MKVISAHKIKKNGKDKTLLIVEDNGEHIGGSYSGGLHIKDGDYIKAEITKNRDGSNSFTSVSKTEEIDLLF